MNLTFERGDPEHPAGHAVLYFTTGVPERILATYLVIPPIELNLAKYMPPMFMANLSVAGMEAETARPIPLPPVPEEVPGRAYLQQMAAVRGDDLLYGGAVLDDNPQRLMLETGYAAEAYGQRYDDHTAGSLAPPAPEPEFDASTALYSVMGDGQRLAELTKLTGALREATEQGDARTSSENLREMRSLLETLPAKYRGNHLLSAAQKPGEAGRRLCQLLLERAYALHREEYLDVGRIDREIDAVDAPPA